MLYIWTVSMWCKGMRLSPISSNNYGACQCISHVKKSLIRKFTTAGDWMFAKLTRSPTYSGQRETNSRFIHQHFRNEWSLPAIYRRQSPYLTFFIGLKPPQYKESSNRFLNALQCWLVSLSMARNTTGILIGLLVEFKWYFWLDIYLVPSWFPAYGWKITRKY